MCTTNAWPQDLAPVLNHRVSALTIASRSGVNEEDLSQLIVNKHTDVCMPTKTGAAKTRPVRCLS